MVNGFDIPALKNSSLVRVLGLRILQNIQEPEGVNLFLHIKA